MGGRVALRQLQGADISAEQPEYHQTENLKGPPAQVSGPPAPSHGSGWALSWRGSPAVVGGDHAIDVHMVTQLHRDHHGEPARAQPRVGLFPGGREGA